MTENRRATRHDVDVPCTVTINEQELETAIKNLSAGGAFFAYDERLPMGEKVTLKFAIPSLEEPIEVAAVVRWCDTSGIGVQFSGLRPRFVWGLNQYFDTLH